MKVLEIEFAYKMWKLLCYTCCSEFWNKGLVRFAYWVDIFFF